MNYYTTEKSDSAASRQWDKTNAQTLAGAKMVSRKRQLFVGTCCAVGVDRGRGIEQIAATRFDGTWNDKKE